MSVDENIVFSVLCKNTDKFSKIVEIFYEKFPEYRDNSSFMINGSVINMDSNLVQENINNNIIITILKNK